MKSLYFVLIFAAALTAQYEQIRIMDVPQGVENGTIELSATPQLSQDKVLRAFDNNGYTETIWSDTNQVTLLVQLKQSIPITKIRFFWWNQGTFSLEVAQSMQDLENRTSSWQTLADDRACRFFQWDSLVVDAVSATVMKLQVNADGNQVILGEWQTIEQHTITALQILPEPLKLLPKTDLQMQVNKVDESGNTYPVDLSVADMIWSSSDPSVATVSLDGVLHGERTGSGRVTVTWGDLSAGAPFEVLQDFRPQLAEPAKIKVAVVYQNPVIESAGGIKLHEKENWNNPRALVQDIMDFFAETTEGVVQFGEVETHDDDTLFTVMNGEFLTPEQVADYLDEPNWQSLKDAHQADELYFDYNAMLEYYDFCSKREAGLIDEVWVYAWAYAGMYESQLTGDNAFWWNAPPLKGNECHKLLSIMGLNYERGLPEGVHSFGHRMESAIRRVYGRWNIHAQNPNNWELFTRYDKETPGNAHVGNIHFPPNGVRDYDYGNRNTVKTYADNWLRYPYLFDIPHAVNCEEWGCTQLGYLRWWYAHIPRYKGVTDGVLNNWWHYFYDYEAAVKKAETWTAVESQFGFGQIIKAFELNQNYPNPFNSQTRIEYTLPQTQRVTLRIFNVLGENVATLVRGRQGAGHHQVVFNADNLPSGLYLYRLQTPLGCKTRKLLLIN
jgi:hypothetical protein